jgi:hypothetical protein
MSGEPTVIYSAASSQQAHLLKSLLAERGIAAWVVNDSIQIAGGELPLGWTAAAKVVVGDLDAAEARQFALEFDQRPAQVATEDDPAKTTTVTDDWADWPTCPKCQERRSARCPVCSVSGTRFPLADLDDSGDEPRVLLICESCDDHFLPEWFRLCPHCGHDYGDGIVLEPASRPLDAVNSRAVTLVAALVVGGVLLFLYFTWLLR